MEEQQCQFLDHFFKQSAVRYPDTIPIEQITEKFGNAEIATLASRITPYLIEKAVSSGEKAVALLLRFAHPTTMIQTN